MDTSDGGDGTFIEACGQAHAGIYDGTVARLVVTRSSCKCNGRQRNAEEVSLSLRRRGMCTVLGTSGAKVDATSFEFGMAHSHLYFGAG